MTAFRDKVGTWTTVAYDSELKARMVVVDTASGTPLNITSTLIAQQSLGYHLGDRAASVYSMAIGPRADTTRIGLDGFGGVVQATDALGNLSLFYRTNSTFPGVVTRMRRANGQVIRSHL